MDRVNQFKKKRFEFGSVEARIARACKIEKRRKQQRAEDIARNRFPTVVDAKLSKVISSPEEIRSDNNRVKQLLKWKTEKELKKKIEAQTKKPPFIVGIPHHKPWPTAINNNEVFDCQHHKNNKAKLIVPTRITRATAKRLAEKEKLIKADTLLKCKPETIKKEKKKCNGEPIAIFPVTEHHVFRAPKGIAPVRMLDAKSFSINKKLQILTDDIVENSNKNNNTNNQTKMNMNLGENVNHMNESQSQNDTYNKSCSDMKLIEEEEKSHKIALENNLLHENDISVLLQSSVPAALSPFITSKRGKSNIRDEQRERLGLNSPRNIVPTKDNITEILSASTNESPETAQYYKYLLTEETDRLNNLCEHWKKIQENLEITDDGRYIINQAIGQTILLINKKFKRFDGLVSDCIKGNKELLVTCRDLQGFWDMMSMEIKNCHSRFEKLEKLNANSWIEDKSNSPKVIKIKKQPMKKNKINGKSNMRAFIKASRKQKMNDQGVNSEFDHIIISKSQHYQTRASLGKQNQIKTPQPKLGNTIAYISSEQTPGKGILKHNNEIVKLPDELNKSTVKVNFDEVIIYDSTSSNRLITQGTDNKKSLSKTKTIKRRKSLPMDSNTIPKRILRSNSQFENNIMTSTVKKIEHFKEQKIKSVSSSSNESNIKSDDELMKENNYSSTPRQRRSTRKSIKLNYSGECTACT